MARNVAATPTAATMSAAEEDAEGDRRPCSRSDRAEHAAAQLARHDLRLDREEKRVDRSRREARHREGGERDRERRHVASAR